MEHRRTVLVVAIAALVLAIAPTAFADPGGHNGGGDGSLSLVMVSDVNTPGVSYGDTVTFNASTTATTEPHVRLQCFQSGALVLTRDAGMYASYPWAWEQNMLLSSSLWTAGAADCTAQIYYFAGSKTVWSTSLSFYVDA